MATWSRRLSGRISQEAVDETMQRKGELVVLGRYSSSRRLASDIEVDESVLGAGATGKVQLATRAGGHRCAVKSVQKKKLSKSARDLLMNEAGLYLSLDHPHIAKLDQVYESRREIHFVMEHLQGGELLQRLKRVTKFSEEQAAEAMRQMLLAVAYLHAHQVAHRDLKPENFVYERVDGNHLKMIDFGFANRFTPGGRMSQPCGSLHYVAPEVLTKSYTEKADLWSMGVIAYTLLCGRGPWHPYKDSRKETLKKVTAGDVFYCPERFGSLSHDAQSFVKSLLTFDPKKRLSAADALQHKWIQRLTAPAAQVDSDMMQSLRLLEQTRPLRKVCLSMAASHLTTKETEQIREQFHAIDSNNKGALSLDDFKLAVGEDDENVDVASLFANADLDNDGEIGYTSFLVASMQQRPGEEILRPIFNRLDADRNGRITARDLRSILGPSFAGFSMDELIKEADSTGDGSVSWDEFYAYVTQQDSLKLPDDSEPSGCFLKSGVDKARLATRKMVRRVSGRSLVREVPGGLTEGTPEAGSRGVAKWFLRLPIHTSV